MSTSKIKESMYVLCKKLFSKRQILQNFKRLKIMGGESYLILENTEVEEASP